ncbi:unnamed protein product [Dovyalis caffra]|uniref:Defensin-like protein n=1 Tax=Dovyalis caffra TaxID=77055 RepID=A0AAV1SGC3_9ROSI|nr:unnamed protein product [Dovyalis caffra]
MKDLVLVRYSSSDAKAVFLLLYASPPPLDIRFNPMLVFVAAVESGVCQIGGLSRCVRSWDCKDKKACKDECSSGYAGGYGLCTGNPNICLCSYDCPPL